MANDAAGTIVKFFASESAERGAAMANALLSNIQAAGRPPRFTGDDWNRLGKMLVLADVSGPLEGLAEAVEAERSTEPPAPAVVNGRPMVTADRPGETEPPASPGPFLGFGSGASTAEPNEAA